MGVLGKRADFVGVESIGPEFVEMVIIDAAEHPPFRKGGEGVPMDVSDMLSRQSVRIPDSSPRVRVIPKTTGEIDRNPVDTANPIRLVD